MSLLEVEAYGYGDDDPNSNTGCYSDCSLAVVVRSEETWVLEGSINFRHVSASLRSRIDTTGRITANQGQLCASQDGIEIKVGHIKVVHVC
jgi:hypothetical protein